MAELRKRLIARLAKLGVQDRPLPGRDDGFSALVYGGKAFAHFHHDHELDIGSPRRSSSVKAWCIRRAPWSTRSDPRVPIGSRSGSRETPISRGS